MHDTQTPVVTCPAPVSVQCAADVPTPNVALVTAVDNCDPNPTIAFVNDVSDGLTCPETITRTYSATDNCGNIGVCTQVITVHDTQNPVVTCPDDVTVGNDPGQCGAIVSFTVDATDNCNIYSITASPPSGSYFALGTTPVTVVVFDSCSNETSCTFNVTVVDTEDPVANCPTDITVGNDAGGCDAVVNFAATATDNCPGVSIASTPPSGSTFPVGVTTVTCTAIDAAGNTNACQFDVTVNDTENPTATCPDGVSVQCAVDVPAADIGLVTASDNCTGLTVTHEGDQSDGQSCPETITRTYRVTDAAGNFVECTQTITVDDTIAPVFDQTCPVNVTAECDAVPDAAVLTATDNCDASIAVAFDEQITPGSCDNSYTITRTWTATDICSNSSSCVQVIDVVDTTPPVCTTPNDTSFFFCEPTEVCLPVGCEDNCTQNIVPTILSGPGVIANGMWCYTALADEVSVVTIQCDDGCGNTCQSTFTVSVDLNAPPIASCPQIGTIFRCDLSEICIPGFEGSDEDNNLATKSVLVGELTGDEICFTPVEGLNVLTFIVTDSCGEADTCRTNINIDLNDPPQVSCPPSENLHWGDLYERWASATDPNIGQALSFSLGAGSPMVASVNQAGLITWQTTGNDVCENQLIIIITDSCGLADTCTIDICVENDPPVITCPTDTTLIAWGYTATGGVSASDPDEGPQPFNYTVVSFDGPGLVEIDAETGVWSWTTEEMVDYLGYFELCIAVDDGAAICADKSGCSPHNADTCCVTVFVVPTADIIIEKTHNAIQGQYESVSITLDSTVMQMGGFDLLIAYDASALAPAGVTPGQLLEDCGWEYFTYRHGADGNCGDACPSGLLRIIAIAETNNGPNHPLCYGPPDTDPHELANLKFMVTNDRTFECQYVPIHFYWDDCGDNSISSVSGDTLYVDRAIYYFESDLIWDEEDDDQFPEDARPQGLGAPDICLNPDPEKPAALRMIDFHNGGVDIVCADSIDDRGDLNLNGVANEISDAVLLSNYFVLGMNVFTENLEGQIAASDVNADGITLSVADLVYLIRIITGDAPPYPKAALPVNVSYMHNSDGRLQVRGDLPMGAVWVIAAGELEPVLLADDVELKYGFDGVNTRMLVYSLEGNSFTGPVLEFFGDIVSIEMATAEGNPVVAKLLPTEFVLYQNFPNPFNPRTEIAFDLPIACDVTLEVFNTLGQRVVALVDEYLQPGAHVVEFDNAALSSGIYFFRLQAGQFAETKKMVLLK